MSIISSNIEKAVAILSNDDVVAIPTETVYGLAGNAFSEKAIRKIFEVKQRPLFNPLIIHTHSVDGLADLVSEFPKKAQQLAEAFWPGSLTMVLKKKPAVPDLITGGKDTVAVRVPNHPVTLALLKKLPFPLAAPSANPFSCISPTTAQHVADYFPESIDMVLEGGTCANGIESTIIGFENNEPVLYRLGSISVEEITSVIGPIAFKNTVEKAPSAPGMLARHYAPKTKTYLVHDVATFAQQFPNQRVGVLLFSKKLEAPNVTHQEIVSQTGDLKEAASNLYQALHHLDKAHIDLIIAERFPDQGLGQSINDRLTRATKNE